MHTFVMTKKKEKQTSRRAMCMFSQKQYNYWMQTTRTF